MIGSAILIGATVDTNIPICANIPLHKHNEITYCIMSGLKLQRLEDAGHGIEEVRLVEPFCDVHENVVSLIAMKRLRAVICYLSFTVKAGKHQRELNGYDGFEKDLKDAIGYITLKNMDRRGTTLQELKDTIVPARIFQEDLPEPERFAPYTSTTWPLKTLSQISSAETGAKRLREERDGSNVSHRPTKRANPGVADASQHSCHAVHEQLAIAYSDSVKTCNQLRSDKETLEARIIGKEMRITQLETTVADRDKDLKKAQAWKPKFEASQRELKKEKDSAKERMKKAKAEDEAEVEELEKQVRALNELVAKKQTKYGSLS